MTIVLLILIGLMLLLMSSRKEMFGYAGHEDPVNQVTLDDTSFDTAEYVESTEINIDNDLMQKLVLATNKYVSDKTGLCTYIIETTSIKKYVHRDTKKDLYRCMFMFMKQHGFVFGFAVTADVMVNPDGTVKVMSARTQPIDVMPPTDQSPYQSDLEGYEFTDYRMFKESELNLIKNKSL